MTFQKYVASRSMFLSWPAWWQALAWRMASPLTHTQVTIQATQIWPRKDEKQRNKTTTLHCFCFEKICSWGTISFGKSWLGNASRVKGLYRVQTALFNMSKHTTRLVMSWVQTALFNMSKHTTRLVMHHPITWCTTKQLNHHFGLLLYTYMFKMFQWDDQHRVLCYMFKCSNEMNSIGYYATCLNVPMRWTA